MTTLYKHLVTMTSLRENNPNFNYSCFEDFVLDRGRLFYKSDALTDEEKRIVNRAILSCEQFGIHFAMRECYYNAQALALVGHGHIKYVEGYAAGRACIPVLHGWCHINGKLIDLTWRVEEGDDDTYENRVMGEIPDDWSYYGVEFKHEDVVDNIEKGSCSMIDDYMNGFPLLQLERLSPQVKEVVEMSEERKRAVLAIDDAIKAAAREEEDG